MKLFLFSVLLPIQLLAQQADFSQQLSNAVIELTQDEVIYDPSYFSIAYPNGDIPKNKGVCIDVVIRAYRKLGIDLQQKVHQDMRSRFSEYPKIWELSRPDSNIDHRRVPNLMAYFDKHAEKIPIILKPQDYKTGDIEEVFFEKQY